MFLEFPYTKTTKPTGCERQQRKEIRRKIEKGGEILFFLNFFFHDGLQDEHKMRKKQNEKKPKNKKVNGIYQSYGGFTFQFVFFSVFENFDFSLLSVVVVCVLRHCGCCRYLKKEQRCKLVFFSLHLKSSARKRRQKNKQEIV